MITLCHAAKGGSGTTLVAAVLALESPGPTLLVDLESDAPAVLGVAEPDRPGVIDWLSSDAPTEHLDDLLVEPTDGCTMLPSCLAPAVGRAPTIDPATDPVRWSALHDWLRKWAHDSGGSVVIDAGTAHLPAEFVEACDHRWLVTRPCYLSLRHAARLAIRPTGIVVVDEPGRSLGRRDIETAVGAPIVATIAWDMRVSRSVDAGLLLTTRLPRVIRRALVVRAA